MTELLPAAIGIGLAVNLVFSELFGLAAGGMVVPGYFALYLNRPIDIGLTLAASLATYLTVHLLSTFMIIYGRRRTMLTILIGYLVRMLMGALPMGKLASIEMLSLGDPQFMVIGFIVPGLIAIWIDRQGLIETLSALLAAAVAIRMILILIFGMELSV